MALKRTKSWSELVRLLRLEVWFRTRRCEQQISRVIWKEMLQLIAMCQDNWREDSCLGETFGMKPVWFLVSW